MNCRLSEDYMMRYCDGELNDIENAQLKQHMKSCNQCSKDFSEFEDMIGMIETDSLIEIPADFETQVMQKIRKLEPGLQSKNSRWMVYVYNLAAVSCALLLLIFVANLKEVSLLKIWGQAGGYFNSFSSLTQAVYGFLRDGYDVAASIARALFQVTVLLVKTYYHVLITLAALLLAMQKPFFKLLRQENANRK